MFNYLQPPYEPNQNSLARILVTGYGWVDVLKLISIAFKCTTLSIYIQEYLLVELENTMSIRNPFLLRIASEYGNDNSGIVVNIIQLLKTYKKYSRDSVQFTLLILLLFFSEMMNDAGVKEKILKFLWIMLDYPEDLQQRALRLFCSEMSNAILNNYNSKNLEIDPSFLLAIISLTREFFYDDTFYNYHNNRS